MFDRLGERPKSTYRSVYSQGLIDVGCNEIIVATSCARDDGFRCDRGLFHHTQDRVCEGGSLSSSQVGPGHQSALSVESCRRSQHHHRSSYHS